MKKNKVGAETLDKTVKIYQRDKISINLKIAQPEWSNKQKEFIELVRDQSIKIIFLKGPAGSSKTFISMWAALSLLNIGRIQEIICVRSVIESSSVGLGFLKGDINEKMSPYAEPYMEKMRQFIPQSQIDLLIKDNRIQFLPINFLRGREFNASFIIADEVQNFSEEEIQTLLTRYGYYSKLILSGDTEQSDLENFRKMKSGFKSIYDWYNKLEAVAEGLKCFKFGIEDIKREKIIGYLVEEFQKFKQFQKNK